MFIMGVPCVVLIWCLDVVIAGVRGLVVEVTIFFLAEGPGPEQNGDAEDM